MSLQAFFYYDLGLCPITYPSLLPQDRTQGKLSWTPEFTFKARMGPVLPTVQHGRKEIGRGSQVGCVVFQTALLLMNVLHRISCVIFDYPIICSSCGSWQNGGFLPIPFLISPYWQDINRNIDFCSEEETSLALWCAGTGLT